MSSQQYENHGATVATCVQVWVCVLWAKLHRKFIARLRRCIITILLEMSVECTAIWWKQNVNDMGKKKKLHTKKFKTKFSAGEVFCTIFCMLKVFY